MKWYKTSEILPETNRQLLLLIKGDITYSTVYQIPAIRVVMGVYLKNELENKLFPDVFSDQDYYFELLCCEMVYATPYIIAWSYVPSVSEIEESFSHLQ